MYKHQPKIQNTKNQDNVDILEGNNPIVLGVDKCNSAEAQAKHCKAIMNMLKDFTECLSMS